MKFINFIYNNDVLLIVPVITLTLLILKLLGISTISWMFVFSPILILIWLLAFAYVCHF